MGGRPGPPEERFWRWVKKTRGCWRWTGAVDTHGYGRFNVGDGRLVAAHRYAVELVEGSAVPRGVVVMHTCDTPCCVRYEHLRKGTQAENQVDMVVKGRSARGARNGRAVLTKTQVRAIRFGYRAGKTQQALADRYGVSQTLVGRIVRREVWA